MAQAYSLSKRVSIEWLPDAPYEDTDTLVLQIGSYFLDVRIRTTATLETSDAVDGTAAAAGRGGSYGIDWSFAGTRSSDPIEHDHADIVTSDVDDVGTWIDVPTTRLQGERMDQPQREYQRVRFVHILDSRGWHNEVDEGIVHTLTDQEEIKRMNKVRLDDVLRVTYGDEVERGRMKRPRQSSMVHEDYDDTNPKVNADTGNDEAVDRDGVGDRDNRDDDDDAGDHDGGEEQQDSQLHPYIEVWRNLPITAATPDEIPSSSERAIATPTMQLGTSVSAPMPYGVGFIACDETRTTWIGVLGTVVLGIHELTRGRYDSLDTPLTGTDNAGQEKSGTAAHGAVNKKIGEWCRDKNENRPDGARHAIVRLARTTHGRWKAVYRTGTDRAWAWLVGDSDSDSDLHGVDEVLVETVFRTWHVLAQA